MKHWLLLDMNYLCYRAHYAMGGRLSFEGEPTATVFGVLKDIKKLPVELNADGLVFCFDHGKQLREALLPSYKSTRRKRKMEDDEAVALEGMKSQVDKLKFEYLEKMGHQNVFFQKGYEADDIIASVVHNLDDDEWVTIVSADKDLLQLLQKKKVRMYNPANQTMTTYKKFREEWGIEPARWVDVKSIAGCSTDDIPGLKGIGEKTAAKFLRGEVPKHHANYKAISDYFSHHDFSLAKRLVRLPFGGCNNFVPVKDDLKETDAGLERLAKRLGMESLVSTGGARGVTLDND